MNPTASHQSVRIAGAVGPPHELGLPLLRNAARGMILYAIFAATSLLAAQTFAYQSDTNTPPAPEPTAATNTPAATPVPPPSEPTQRSAAELEKLVMPIALHPDPLIAIILPASVYPVEVVQAARFVRDTNNIPKLDEQPWDENVKAVAKFPEMIAKMDADLEWTIALGQAFVDQPKELMDAIQSLRAKAQAAGTLQTTAQQVVIVTNQIIERTVEQQVVPVTQTVVEIVPANPQVVYVPTYPPTVYYPPPAYVYDPYAPLVTFGVGLAVGAIIANNSCDWHGGGVYVGHHGVAVWGGGGDYHSDVDINVDRDTTINRGDRNPRPRPNNTNSKWQPDQNRMRSSGAPSAKTREARGWGSSQPSQRPAGGATGGARPSQLPANNRGAGAAQRPTASTRPAAPSRGYNSAAQRPAAPASRPAQRPVQQPSVNQRPAVQNRAPQNNFSGGGSAFGRSASGPSTRQFSNRGSVSRGGGGGFRGGGGGRRR